MRRRFLAGLRSTADVPAVEAKMLGGSVTFGDLGGGSGGPISVTPGYGARSYGGMVGAQDRSAGWNLERVVTEGYEQNIWVFRCVELYAGNQARLPYVIARQRGKPDEEVIEDHPLYRVMNKRANPHESSYVFRKRLSMHVLLSKRGAFVEITRSRGGAISRLDLLDPSRCRPMPSSSGDYLDHFEFTTLRGEVRQIPPERIRWIREPHPLDPFCGTTPLEAAGMSVDLDFLARVYNVNFIRNDARPGGVLGVDVDTVSDQEVARLQTKLGGGAHRAGELAVIGTGPGGLEYVDTTTRPRDMAYGEMAGIVKMEVLSAFGIGESLLGNASNSTFANAEQEEFNFWSKPMPPHLNLIGGIFEDDLDGEEDGYLDTSGIDALEVGKRAAREEARAEFEAGLRSIDEYRPLAGLGVVEVAQTRALWINPSKAPVGVTPEDQAELSGGEASGEEGFAPEGEEGEVLPGEDGAVPQEGGDPALAGQPGAQAVEEARALGDGEEGEAPGAAAAVAVDEARQVGVAAGAGGEDAAVAVDAARSLDAPREAGEGAAAVDAARAMAEAEREARNPVQRKALRTTGGRGAPRPGALYEVSESALTAAHQAITAALAALLDRQQGVILARLESPKTRKGTRYWAPDSPSDTRGGEGGLDVLKAINPEQWATEVTEVLSEPVQDATLAAATEFLRALAAGGHLNLPAGVSLPQLAGRITATITLRALARAVDAMRSWLDTLTQQVAIAEADAAGLEDVTAFVRRAYAERGKHISEHLAGDVAMSAVNGSVDAVADAVTARSDVVTRTWVTRGDEKVRASHVAADGEDRRVGAPFLVGGEPLAYPQDPAASPAQTFGCRCRLRYEVRQGSTLPEARDLGA